MSTRPPSSEVCWIEVPEQLAAIISAIRQEILDNVKALGPCSIADLAHELGVPADSLYYHVRKLVDVGLLVDQGSRSTARRDETIYDIPHRNLRIRYDLADPKNVQMVGKIAGSMLRVAEQDFRKGLGSERAVVEGPGRTIWASRLKAWLTKDEIEEVNRHLEGLAELFGRPRRAGDRELYTVSWVMAPIEDQPIRR